MLPYQLPVPKKRYWERTFDDSLQRAIEADLRELRDDFKAAVQQANAAGHHSEPGTSFGAFRSVFGPAKVAALHTRLAPQRIDMNAYSQLLYAAGWSLLHESMGDQSLLDPIYAIFCVYALYETNPLPDAPSIDSDEEAFRLLPMAAQNRENPKRLFRRNYRAPVRIDIEHYRYLCQLKDRAQAQRAACEADRLSTNEWSCRCGAATDLLYVLNRLKLDYCAYTGPCSLEGLAGHPDYAAPKAVSQPTPTASESTFSPSEDYTPTDDLVQSLQSYLTHRSAIRLPPAKESRRADRLREALQPLFSGTSNPLATLTQTLGSPTPATAQPVKIRRVTFGHIVVDGQSQAAASKQSDPGQDRPSCERMTGHQPSCERMTGPFPELPAEPETHNLILPLGLSERQAISLQSAVETLLSRDSSMLMPVPVAGKGDEVSTLGSGGVSVASSATGAGQAALRQLLSRIPVQHLHAKEAATMNTFLDTAEAAARATKPSTGGDELSDISSDEDEVSVAASAIGQKALSDLLAKSTGKAKSKRRSGQKQSARSSPKRKAPPKQKTPENDESSEASGGDSVSQSMYSSQGRQALEALLGRARRF